MGFQIGCELLLKFQVLQGHETPTPFFQIITVNEKSIARAALEHYVEKMAFYNFRQRIAVPCELVMWYQML